MPSTMCANCGAEIATGARFCRQCGRPSPAMESTSVTEATTRFLETPVGTADAVGAVTYTAPEPAELSAAGTRSVPAAAATQSLIPPKRRRNVLLLSLALSGVLLAAFAALLALWYGMKPAGVSTPPIPIVRHPPLPPAPIPPVGDRNPTETNPLVYPNAAVVRHITSAGQPSLVQIRSPDSFAKVVAWYEAKLRPTEKVIMPGSHAVLKAGKATVIIKGATNETNIMLTQLSDE